MKILLWKPKPQEEKTTEIIQPNEEGESKPNEEGEDGNSFENENIRPTGTTPTGATPTGTTPSWSRPSSMPSLKI